MRRRLGLPATGFPLLAGTLTVGVFYGGFLRGPVVPAVRDVPFFHLPLRDAFATFARQGVPWWNPLIHGGQPLLSNPNYAAFYPPTWLALALAPHRALALIVVLHAVWAFAGAWRLARTLECRPPAAALAAVGFVGGGAFLSSPTTLNLFCGLAWLPWVLTWGERALSAGRGQWARPAVLAGAGLAAQLLAGEPVMALIGAAALACWAGERARHGPGRPLRLVPVALIAGGLAAVQLLPTAQRLLESPRAGGLAGTGATVWSTPPARAVEFALPRFFGDPMLEDLDLYFGYGLHDKDFPYVVSIYCGLLPVLLGLVALARWRLPRRAAWWAMLALGAALALGRHNPLYAGLLIHLPPFNLVRYPEKFILLATSALPFAAALGWEELMRRRRAGRPQAAELPLALALVAVAVTGGLAALLAWRPTVGEQFVRLHSLLPRSPEGLAAAAGYLQREALAATAVAAAAAALLALHRWRQAPGALLAGLALVLLGGDLFYYGRTLNPLLPAREVLTPPAMAERAAGGGGRIFTDRAFHQGRAEFTFRGTEPQVTAWLRNGLDRLDPFAANLWGLAYALNEDYDLMLTAWGRHGLDRFYEAARQGGVEGEAARRVLGAWGVGALALRRPAREVAAEWAAGGGTPDLVRLVANPGRLPLVRLAPEVLIHDTVEAATAALGAAGFAVDRLEHCGPALPPAAPGRLRSPADARLLEHRPGPGTHRLSYRASGPALLVVAETFDRGWEARAGDRRLPVCPTALGQLGVLLPPGQGELTLAYRDPWVKVGAALTLITALAGALTIVRPARQTDR